MCVIFYISLFCSFSLPFPNINSILTKVPGLVLTHVVGLVDLVLGPRCLENRPDVIGDSRRLELEQDEVILKVSILKFIVRCISSIEIGLERAAFVVFVYFSSSFEHAKNLLFMGPNTTKNSS